MLPCNLSTEVLTRICLRHKNGVNGKFSQPSTFSHSISADADVSESCGFTVSLLCSLSCSISVLVAKCSIICVGREQAHSFRLPFSVGKTRRSEAVSLIVVYSHRCVMLRINALKLRPIESHVMHVGTVAIHAPSGGLRQNLAPGADDSSPPVDPGLSWNWGQTLEPQLH